MYLKQQHVRTTRYPNRRHMDHPGWSLWERPSAIEILEQIVPAVILMLRPSLHRPPTQIY